MSGLPYLPQSMGIPSTLTCESQTLQGTQGIRMSIDITPVSDNSKHSISEQENSDKEDINSQQDLKEIRVKSGIIERLFAKPKYKVLAELWEEIHENLRSERNKNSQLMKELEEFKGYKIALAKSEAEKESLKAENITLETRLKEASESNKISRLILEKIETINVKGILDKSNETTLRARFNNISLLSNKNIYSQSAELAGVIWKIGLVRIGDNLRIFLHGNNENAAKWSCSVYTKFLLISHKSEDIVHTHCTKKPDVFHETKVDWGFSKFISFKDLYNEEKGFVKDDSILVAVVFKVFPTN